MSEQRAKGGLSVSTVLGYLVCAVFVALVADIMQPQGPFVFYLAVVFVVVAVMCALLSFAPPLRSVMRAAASFAVVSVVIFGLFFGLQSFVAPKPAGEQRGFLAAMIPPAQDVQRWILAEAKKRENLNPEIAAAPVPPPLPAPAPETPPLKRLQAAVAGTDLLERTAAASEALNTKDAAQIIAAVDLLYATADPRLRLLAVRRLAMLRTDAKLTLIATGEGDAAAFAAALQAGGLTFKSVNETSGAVSGGLCGPSGMTGAINVANVVLSGRCRVGREERAVTMVLTAADSYRLVGEATNDAGQKAKVELQLS